MDVSVSRLGCSKKVRMARPGTQNNGEPTLITAGRVLRRSRRSKKLKMAGSDTHSWAAHTRITVGGVLPQHHRYNKVRTQQAGT